MGFQVGDKVSFLNEKLDGVVSKVINDKSVEVTTEDGFGIPVLNSEIVLVAAGETKGEENKVSNKKPVQVQIPSNSSLERKDFLAFSKTGESSVELYLINNTNLKKFYCLRTFKGGSWTVVFNEEVGKQSFKFVGQFSIQEIEQFGNVKVDQLVTEFSIKEYQSPKVAQLKVKAVKIYKEASYSHVPILQKSAMVIPIESSSIEEQEVKEAIIKDVERRVVEKDKTQKGPKILGKIDLKKASPKQKYVNEIDLHIEKLGVKYKGKSNGEIVQIQLNKAQDFLDKSMLAGKSEIVMIHGVGNGRLKEEIRKMLKGYFGIRFEDADFRKYGEGATLVYLK